ncbi:MAG: GreA/GreB family elongation factor [Lachnospiraceae bacterium]|nr:GreA/GreB family elongation factor [Lachnospiraceae bacterium]MBR3036558.1 GreA/GreB family elongation factor [Lachnospiraceae bacterium]
MKLTKADIAKIQEEIDFRKGAHRTELLENLKTARAQGDLSENFEYTMAKRANNQNNSRVAYLERMIRNAEIIEDTAADDVVGLNKEVTIYIPEDDETEVYKIVSSIRGDSTKGRISTDSPLGKALAGHKAGDVVTVRVNDAYAYEAEIKKVVPVVDDGSDEIRQY